jgi:glycosyltransferase involved in cell wall biosynthesis
LNKIKLLLIAPSFYPVHGGAGLRFYRYLPLFHENDVDVTVICGTPKLKKFTEEDHQSAWLDALDGQLISELEIEKAKILKYKVPGKGSKSRSEVLLNEAIELCENQATKPDVIHIIAPMPYGVLGKLRQLRALGVKLVYSHTIARKFSRNKLVEKLQKWKQRRINKQYHLVIVQSASMKEIILEINPAANIYIVLNGVDTEKFSPAEDAAKADMRDLLNLPRKACLITLVGAVHPRKGTDILIDAWSKLVERYPDLHLLIIGPRYDQTRIELKEFKESMEAIIKNSGKDANVHFIGQVEGIDRYLKASDMFVFPSEREGMPNAVLEAMSSGLPVVLTPFVGLSDELGMMNKEYLLANRSAESVAEKINLILDDNDLSQALAANARNWVVAKMNLTTSVKSHCNLYVELLAA